MKDTQWWEWGRLTRGSATLRPCFWGAHNCTSGRFYSYWNSRSHTCRNRKQRVRWILSWKTNQSGARETHDGQFHSPVFLSGRGSRQRKHVLLLAKFMNPQLQTETKWHGQKNFKSRQKDEKKKKQYRIKIP